MAGGVEYFLWLKEDNMGIAIKGVRVIAFNKYCSLKAKTFLLTL